MRSDYIYPPRTRGDAVAANWQTDAAHPTRTINAVIHEAARLRIGGDSGGLTQWGEHWQQACCGRAAKENGLASAYIRCLFVRFEQKWAGTIFCLLN